MTESTKPLLVIISGPSGVGKDAILTAMKKSGKPYFFAVTATTRKQRPGEIEGVDYHFVSRQDFERMIEHGELMEWANVYGNFYGVPKQPVVHALAQGRDAIVKVDIQGAAAIKCNIPEAVSIFILPPSMEELRRRLIARKTESHTDLELRLRTAEDEMKSVSSFDHVVISHRDEVGRAIADIEAIIKAVKKGSKSGASTSGETSRR